MGVLPVPEIVKEMAHKIDEIALAVKSVGAKVDALHLEMAELKARERRISELSLRMETVDGKVATLADRVAWLSTSA